MVGGRNLGAFGSARRARVVRQAEPTRLHAHFLGLSIGEREHTPLRIQPPLTLTAGGVIDALAYDAYDFHMNVLTAGLSVGLFWPKGRLVTISQCSGHRCVTVEFDASL